MSRRVMQKRWGARRGMQKRVRCPKEGCRRGMEKRDAEEGGGPEEG
jgi:hypothetical protein